MKQETAANQHLTGGAVLGSNDQARTHALLPLAAWDVDILELLHDVFEGLAAKLSHLEVKQCRNNRKQRQDQNVDYL